MERIWTSHCCGKVVNHQALEDALEEDPGSLQPLDHVDKLLAERRSDEAVPRVCQNDDQRPGHPAAAHRRVLYSDCDDIPCHLGSGLTLYQTGCNAFFGICRLDPEMVDTAPTAMGAVT